VKVCTTNSTTNRFAICTDDTFCGGAAGSGLCAQTPWVDAGGVTQPTPTATTTFTVTAGSPPTCEHTVCIQCGAIDKCADIQGGCDNCGGTGDPACTPTSTNVNCPFGDTCCQSPGFVLPTLLIGPGVLNFCTKTNQFDCGFGVINTSNPQTGDNELTKEGDTSDPGPDCQYGTGDEPTGKACNSFGTGQGADTRGRIRVTTGNGVADASGIQIRMSTPELATTWSDGQGCPSNATFDAGESLVSQLTLAAEPTTAGSTGAFVELNGDTCKRVGAGFTNLAGTQDGPHTVGSPTVIPMPYGGGPFRSVAMNEVFSGASPLFDLGFVAITPTGAPTFQGAAQACTCSTARKCPECDAGTTGCP